MVLILGRAVYFAPSLGMSLAFKELFNIARNSYGLSQLKLTRDLNGFFSKVALRSEIGPVGN